MRNSAVIAAATDFLKTPFSQRPQSLLAQPSDGRQRPSWVKLSFAVDQGERVVFREKFVDFVDVTDTTIKQPGNVQRKEKGPYVIGAGTIL